MTPEQYPTVVDFSLKLNHSQKFSGASAGGIGGSDTGPTLYLIVQSSIAAGTTAPVFSHGYYEVFFEA